MQIETPFGPAWASVDENGALTRFHFGDPLPVHEGDCQDVARQVAEYFRGERTDFDLPLAPKGTAFQKSVWAELVQIPCGTTTSYGELAKKLGRPGASRAVGRANATNPIWLIVPCHRVIGSTGKLTGYAGGVDLKDKLLAWERKIAPAAIRELNLFEEELLPPPVACAASQ
jgi:methylated-DNA-[protein]-cysteine S-methyltransferase